MHQSCCVWHKCFKNKRHSSPKLFITECRTKVSSSLFVIDGKALVGTTKKFYCTSRADSDFCQQNGEYLIQVHLILFHLNLILVWSYILQITKKKKKKSKPNKETKKKIFCVKNTSNPPDL